MKPAKRKTRRYARFLLAYRFEVCDGPEDAPTGRGWVVRVPDEGEPTLAQRPQAKWFATLSDVPTLLQALLDEAACSDERGSGT